MAMDGDSLGGLEAAAVTDIKMLVEKRLREEHLYHFLRTRDELLRLKRPEDPETVRFLRRQQLHTLKKAWDGVLQALRNELPGVLDQLFSSLQPEFQETVPSARPPDAAPPNTTAAAAAAAAAASADVSGAPPRTDSLAKNGSGRLATSAPKAIVTGADTRTSTTAVVKEKSALGTSDETSNKRPSDNLNEQVTTPPSKKAKKGPQPVTSDIDYKIPIKKIMFLHDVQQDECLFKYPGYSGVYILRCNMPKCRKRLGVGGPIIFTWHPFGDESPAALSHFEGEGHGINDESEIFRKYAIRVIDADTERNTKKKKAATAPDGDLAVKESGLPPTSPSKKKDKGKDKGKKPEGPFSGSALPPQRTAAEASTSASTSASASDVVNETFKQSFYRAGALANECDDDNDEELPPLNRLLPSKAI